VTSVAIHVDQLFFRIPGGIGTYVRELVPALRRADPDLDLIAFHARFDGSEPPELAGVHTVELPHSIRRLYPSWNGLGRPAVPDELDAADVMHATSPAAIPPGGRRLVVTVHDVAFRLYPGMYPPAWRTLFRLGLRRARRADAVIAVSRSTARDVALHGGIDPSRIHVVPLAPSLPQTTTDPGDVLERRRIPRPYLLFVGTLEPRKNLIRLIRAYRRSTARQEHALVIAGPLGWRSGRLHRELASPGPGRVVVTGRVPEADLDALYRGAAAFVYPSIYEGFGLPVLDALARGVPTIVARSSSLPEIVEDAALQVDPRSVRGLAEAIDHVVGDDDERGRLAARGPARAATFSWERTALGTLDVYRSVLDR
jgi:glycosyltransferase involved in cell wall biosynthesis